MNVSNVTNMNYMFNSAKKFNKDLTNWKVGKVTTMSAMFMGKEFNGNISNWDVSKVTLMNSVLKCR